MLLLFGFFFCTFTNHDDFFTLLLLFIFWHYPFTVSPKWCCIFRYNKLAERIDDKIGKSGLVDGSVAEDLVVILIIYVIWYYQSSFNMLLGSPLMFFPIKLAGLFFLVVCWVAHLHWLPENRPWNIKCNFGLRTAMQSEVSFHG